MPYGDLSTFRQSDCLRACQKNRHNSAIMDDDFRQRAEQTFRSLLWRVRKRPLDAAIEALVDGLPAPSAAAEEALSALYRQTRADVIRQLAAGISNRRRRLLETTISPLPPPLGFDFHCDAGLGGLARWLRAAGYDAAFWPGIDDDQLLKKVLGTGSILLSSDTRLFERGVLASSAISSLLVPVTLKKHEQLLFVRRELELPLKPTRCMACGGELLQVEKQSVRDRIPPRTYPWLDDYFVCRRCGRLFWKGTHWQRIATALRTS